MDATSGTTLEQTFLLTDSTTPLQWRIVSAFSPDPTRHRAYDGILDFGCWQNELDVLALSPGMAVYGPNVERLVVVVAGKAESPDGEALQMASEVVSDLLGSLAALRERYPDFAISVDNWTLRAVWFPYQVLGSCWFAVFETEYDGQMQFCFQRAQEENWEVEMLTGNGTGLGDAIFIARECIERLSRPEVSDAGFDRILQRIQEERLVGPELIEDFCRVAAKEVVGLPEWELKHLQESLQQYQESNN